MHDMHAHVCKCTICMHMHNMDAHAQYACTCTICMHMHDMHDMHAPACTCMRVHDMYAPACTCTICIHVCIHMHNTRAYACTCTMCMTTMCMHMHAHVQCKLPKARIGSARLSKACARLSKACLALFGLRTTPTRAVRAKARLFGLRPVRSG